VPHFFADISSHGLGHLAQTAPVLQALSATDRRCRRWRSAQAVDVASGGYADRPQESVCAASLHSADGATLAGQRSRRLHFRLGEQPPVDARVNWLPVGCDAFTLVLRMYEPGRAVIDGSYRPPPIQIIVEGPLRAEP